MFMTLKYNQSQPQCILVQLIDSFMLTLSQKERVQITYSEIIHIINTQHMQQLFQAILSNDLPRIHRILSLPGASQIVNMCDKQQFTAIFYAARLPQESALSIINLLLDKGANPLHTQENKQTVLYYLAKDGKSKIIEKLLTNYKYNLNDLDVYKQTALYWAASHGKLKAAQLLLRHGVNINHLDGLQENVLFWAAKQGHLEMCKFLVNRGCKFDHVDSLKKTPLHFARQNHHRPVVQYLTSLKNQMKKGNQVKREQVQQIKKIKKQVVRHEYVLVRVNEQGEVHQMGAQDLAAFKEKGEYQAKLYGYMCRPQELEEVQAKYQPKFVKIGLKIINSYLRRHQLQLFYAPVDINIYKEYPKFVTHPMDFSTIKTKLQYNCYNQMQKFEADMMLVFQNCIIFNGSQTPLGRLAAQMICEFNQTIRKEMI